MLSYSIYTDKCRGDIAIAAARKPESLEYKGTNDKNFLAVKLDVTKKEDIEAAFKKALDKFGRIDVVVSILVTV